MAAGFRLAVGDRAPRQQSGTTCGPACLTVARMLASPAFARWVESGIGPAGPGTSGSAADRRSRETSAQRFAAHEQLVMRRTNALFGPGGRVQLPWPHALGTPPWGAARDLELALFGRRGESGAVRHRYRVQWLRPGSPARLGSAFDDLRDRAGHGWPSLLYVGSPRLPRHVVLVLPHRASAPTKPGLLEIYEPSAGAVITVPRGCFVAGALGVAGWDTPWATVSRVMTETPL